MKNKEIPIQLLVFKFLKTNQSLTQNKLVTMVADYYGFGKSTARNKILEFCTSPIESFKDKSLYPGIITKAFSIENGLSYAYTLNDHYENVTEDKFEKFLYTHVIVNFELRVS